MRVEPINHRDGAVAQRILDVLLLAHAQESLMLQVPPQAHDVYGVRDIQTSEAFYLGAYLESALDESLAGGPCGVLSVGRDDEPQQLCIQSLVVHPQHQRRGVARQLVQTALGRMPSATFSVVTTAQNEPALRLYAALGFVPYRRGVMGAGEVAVLKLRRVAVA